MSQRASEERCQHCGESLRACTTQRIDKGWDGRCCPVCDHTAPLVSEPRCGHRWHDWALFPSTGRLACFHCNMEAPIGPRPSIWIEEQNVVGEPPISNDEKCSRCGGFGFHRVGPGDSRACMTCRGTGYVVRTLETQCIHDWFEGYCVHCRRPSPHGPPQAALTSNRIRIGYEPPLGGCYLPELDPLNQSRTYVRVSCDGSSFVAEPGQVDDMLKDLPGPYTTEEVQMSPNQFDALSEFQGW